MINKQKLWFLTLFSLILVLSVYYITMPSDLLNTASEPNDKSSVVINVREEDTLSVLRIMSDEERFKEIEELKLVLTNVDSSIEEKNNAYEKMKLIEETKSDEKKLEQKIKKMYNLDSFIKINNTQIKVVIKSDDHNYQLANDIIRSIQEEYEQKMYISVKFQ